MNKAFGIILLMSIFTLTNFTFVSAQGEQPGANTTQQDINEGDAPPIGEEQDPNPPAEVEENKAALEDRNQTLITGGVAGGLIGLVIGGVLSWLFKDKFYKK